MRTAIISLLLFSLARCDPCPDGYTLSPDGGNCFQLKWFFDNFIGQYYPSKSFDQMDNECNNAMTMTVTGGILASIHSAEENENIRTLMIASNGYCVEMYANIGLRCVGKDCRWDDGSPVTYTSFETEPFDDGRTRCYGVPYRGPGKGEMTWEPKDCGVYQADCWLCSVKAMTIECKEGETAYRGGCISIHTESLDQKSAEASCQADGGHLISIHSTYERYYDMANQAGVNGTIYIGGEYTNGKLEWLDGSYPAYKAWAKGFPNSDFGSCVQMLLSQSLLGQWTNVECSTKQPYICFRDGADYGPTVIPPPPKVSAHCPPIQYFNGQGTIYSPNYPQSIPSKQTCEYVLLTKTGSSASVKFEAYNCEAGTSLQVYDGLNSTQPMFTFSKSAPALNSPYTVKSNVMKIIFSANQAAAPVGTGWEADFTGL